MPKDIDRTEIVALIRREIKKAKVVKRHYYDECYWEGGGDAVQGEINGMYKILELIDPNPYSEGGPHDA